MDREDAEQYLFDFCQAAKHEDWHRDKRLKKIRLYMEEEFGKPYGLKCNAKNRTNAGTCQCLVRLDRKHCINHLEL